MKEIIIHHSSVIKFKNKNFEKNHFKFFPMEKEQPQIEKQSDELFLDLERPTNIELKEFNIPPVPGGKYVTEIIQKQSSIDGTNNPISKNRSKSKINGYTGGLKLCTLLFEGFFNSKIF